jgi:hypothetical protein
MKLPVDYNTLSPDKRRLVREEYFRQQGGYCMYCKGKLKEEPPQEVLDHPIRWSYFPPGFLNNPIHLQHNHTTGMTEGAIHAYCNAVLWQYGGR